MKINTFIESSIAGKHIIMNNLKNYLIRLKDEYAKKYKNEINIPVLNTPAMSIIYNRKVEYSYVDVYIVINEDSTNNSYILWIDTRQDRIVINSDAYTISYDYAENYISIIKNPENSSPVKEIFYNTNTVIKINHRTESIFGIHNNIRFIMPDYKLVNDQNTFKVLFIKIKHKDRIFCAEINYNGEDRYSYVKIYLQDYSCILTVVKRDYIDTPTTTFNNYNDSSDNSLDLKEIMGEVLDIIIIKFYKISDIGYITASRISVEDSSNSIVY